MMKNNPIQDQEVLKKPAHNVSGEPILTICAWTKQIQHDGRWISFEEFLNDYLNVRVTHGISPAALRDAELTFASFRNCNEMA